MHTQSCSLKKFTTTSKSIAHIFPGFIEILWQVSRAIVKHSISIIFGDRASTPSVKFNWNYSRGLVLSRHHLNIPYLRKFSPVGFQENTTSSRLCLGTFTGLRRLTPLPTKTFRCIKMTQGPYLIFSLYQSSLLLTKKKLPKMQICF